MKMMRTPRYRSSVSLQTYQSRRGIVSGAACFDEPGVLIGRVVEDELDDHAQAACVRLIQKALEIAQRAVAGMNVRVVGNVVPVVFERRGIHRLQPETVDAERRDVIEPGREAWKIADPVVVAVSERFDVELIKNRVLVPQRIGGSVHRHRGGAGVIVMRGSAHVSPV